MCENCPNRSAGYCGRYDLELNRQEDHYEPIYECIHPTQAD